MTAAASSGIHGQETESLGDITITKEVEKMKDCVEKKKSLIHTDDDNMISYHKKNAFIGVLYMRPGCCYLQIYTHKISNCKKGL